ncbi:MAG TPA: dockerin type I domain-containing protein [Bacteroidales bacterium]|nr:dockerin type I domain-containing protein [Bacteroidales bacterium]HSA42439.1 dockerin type I domain-containing protein [Bacteroidales bacterium]
MKTCLRLFTCTLLTWVLCVFIVPGQELTWTGNVSSDWHTAANWNPVQLPDAGDNVVIPAGLVNYPVITALPAACLDLGVASGASLTLDDDLSVHGDAEISGHISITSYDNLIITGDIDWMPGSTAQMDAISFIKMSGDWTFHAGAAVDLTAGQVQFEGNSDCWITSHDNDCYFQSIFNAITAPGTLNFSQASTADVRLHDFFNSGTGTTVKYYAHTAFRIHGAFAVWDAHIFCYDGDIILQGDPGTDFTPLPGSFLNGLMVDIGTHTWEIWNIYSDTLCIRESIGLHSGQIILHQLVLTVGLNYVDTANNIIYGNSKVVFNGVYPEQVVDGGHFQHLILDNPGGFLGFTDQDIIVDKFEWTAGTVKVMNADVTIWDFIGNGIPGSWEVYSGSLSLHNTSGGLDLMGSMKITNGTVMLTAPGVTVHWPGADNCSFNMSGGILDVRSNGFEFSGSFSNFNYQITGGEIWISGDLLGNNPDFHPDHGTVMFTFDGPSRIYAVPGFAFYDLTIAKCPADTAIMMDNILIKGDFTLNSGQCAAPDTIEIRGDWSKNTLGPSFIPGNGRVIFTGQQDSYIWTDELFYDLVVKKSLADTARLYCTQNSNILILNDLLVQQGSFNLRLNTSLNIGGDAVISLLAGLQSYSGQDNTIYLYGNWINANVLPPNYYRGFRPVKDFIFWGSGDQSLVSAIGYESFNNLRIEKASGEFNPQDGVDISGNLDLVSGTWKNGQAGLIHFLRGNGYVHANGNWNGLINPGIFAFSGPAFQSFAFNGNGCMPEIHVEKMIPEGSSDPYDGRVWLNSDLNCPLGLLVVNLGEFDLNGHTAAFGGGVALLTTAATLEVDTGATLKLGPQGLWSNGGVIRIMGEAGDEATVTHIGQNYYHFTTEFGEIHTRHALFEYMDSQGITLGNATAVNPFLGFSHCTFREGQAGGVLLRLTDQEMMSQHTSFPENSWGSANNVTMLSASGEVNFVGYTGDFSGETYENDPYGNINWLGAMLINAVALPQTINPGESSQLDVVIAGGTEPFTYAWSPLTGLNAADIKAPVASPAMTTTYSVTVTDNEGIVRTDTVTVYVVIPQGAQVSGNISYLSLSKGPLSAVKVVLYQNNTTVDSASTDASGNFNFPFVEAGMYGLHCFSQTPWGGVNATDALIILRHYVGMITLTGLLFEVADVNDNGYVNSLDALITIRRFAGYINGFPAGDWAFGVPQLLMVETTPLVLDFYGLCYGDVNGTYEPPYKMQPQVVLEQEGSIELHQGEETWVSFYAGRQIEIGALSLKLSCPSQLKVLDVRMADGEPALFRLDEGVLSMAWYRIQPLTVSAGAKLFSMLIASGVDDIPAGFEVLSGSETAGPDAVPLESVLLKYPEIRISGEASVLPFLLWPNPASDRLHLDLNLSEISEVSILVYNLTGQCVLSRTIGQVLKESLLLDPRLLGPPGVYQLRLIISGNKENMVADRILVLGK